jgi:hypothetical protein
LKAIAIIFYWHQARPGDVRIRTQDILFAADSAGFNHRRRRIGPVRNQELGQIGWS